MISHVPKGIAERLGYALGLLVRFCIHHRNPKLRWVKRAVVVSLLVAFFVLAFAWIVSVVMSLVCFGLIVLALCKGDFSTLSEIAEDRARKAPYGRDVFGHPFDAWGRSEGDDYDNDPYLPQNINSSLFHESHFNWR